MFEKTLVENRSRNLGCGHWLGRRGLFMKLVMAVIKPFKLDEVREALTELDLDAEVYPCPKGGETMPMMMELMDPASASPATVECFHCWLAGAHSVIVACLVNCFTRSSCVCAHVPLFAYVSCVVIP